VFVRIVRFQNLPSCRLRQTSMGQPAQNQLIGNETFDADRDPHVANRQRVAFCKTAFSSRPKATFGCTAKIGSRSVRMSSCIGDMS